MFRYLLAFILIMHGLAHASGFMTSWTKVQTGFTNRPWFLSPGITMDSTVGRAFGLLWLAAMIALVASGYGLFSKQGWWPEMAIAASILSLIVIVPWWNTVVPGAKAGAFFDLLVIAALLSPWQERLVQILQ